jgi:Flp pilus assembly protein TadD
LSHDLIINGLDSKPYLLLSQLEIQRKNYAKAFEVINDALKLDRKDPSIWAALGNLAIKWRRPTLRTREIF